MFEDLLHNTTDLFRLLIERIDIFNAIPNAYLKYLQFTPIFVLAFILTLLITPLIGHLSIKFKILDQPAHLRDNKLNKFDDPKRHIHTLPVPFLGGLAVVITLITLTLLFLKLTPTLIPILIGLLILIVVGLIDDIFNLPAPVQLSAQIIASLVVVASTIDVTFINNPFNGYFHLEWAKYNSEFIGIPLSLVLPGDLLIIPWIVLCINALKWVAGSDGLLETNSIIAFLLLFVLGVRNTSTVIAALSVISAGSMMGFLVYNFPPAKIFTGSTGKTTYGFLIATLALVNGAKFASTIIILALPIIDSLITIGIRLIKYKPKNPLDLLRINDKSHLHHQLMDLGLSPTKVLLVESSAALIVGALAIFTTGANKLVALIAVIALVTIFISFLHIRSANRKKNATKAIKDESPESKYSY
ncbi:undecaprenyl/decaprenyl-phosphate alpha-N-acetylglucosaminyl 1-phosphate transferase [bacterium]|nr:undecaprenyl/decaprenyl-phosphate alpha-N-acetylglucosaminyl 1-phosphate transferase [bacterium]